MPTDLTAAEVVSLVSPVAGRLGIKIAVAYGNQHDWNEYVEITTGPLERERVSNPANAARLVVGMIAEKFDRMTITHDEERDRWRVVLRRNDSGGWFQYRGKGATILAASCAAFARATEGGSDGA